jgi:hypothetical protein
VPPTPDAELILQRVIHWYRVGQLRPLPWLPKCGYDWAYTHKDEFAGVPLAAWDSVLDSLPAAAREKSADKVREAWSRDKTRAEVIQIFGDTCPAFEGGSFQGAALTREFMCLARDLWMPIITARSTKPLKSETSEMPTKPGKARASRSTGGKQ